MIPTYLKTSFVKTTAITHKDLYQIEIDRTKYCQENH